MRSFRILFPAVLLIARLAAGGTVHVPGDQPTIQSAANAALSGDTVLVAAGTYTGPGNWDVNIGNKTLTFLSESGPSMTILDGGAGSGLVHKTFRVDSAQVAQLTVEGFSIQAYKDHSFYLYSVSSTLTLRDCRFEHFPSDGGAAVYSARSRAIRMFSCVVDSVPFRSYLVADTLEIDSCTFVNCIVGGVINVRLCQQAEIRNSEFRDNQAYSAPAMLVSQSSLLVENCTFENNLGHSGEGGTIAVGESTIDVVQSTFVGNHALIAGAMQISTNTTAHISGCLFAHNLGDRTAGAIVVSSSASLELDHCTLYGNVALTEFGNIGAQIFLLDWGSSSGPGTAVITNSVIAFAGEGRAVISHDQAELDMATYLTIACSNVYGNADGDFTGTLAATYASSGNLSVDPQFVDTSAGDFTYKAGSPMLPENNNCAELMGAPGYVMPTSCCSGLRGNINGDILEEIDISDVTYLVAYMFRGGAAPPCDVEADLNGDTSVDIADLTALVSYSFKGGPAPVGCL